MDAAMDIYNLTKTFPAEEKYALVDQVRRSSRSVAANIAEAWIKRRYEAAFKSKLNDAETEACETQTWIEFAVRCDYLNTDAASRLDGQYDKLLVQLAMMIKDSKNWVIDRT